MTVLLFILGLLFVAVGIAVSIALLYFILRRHFIKRMLEGAVKG